MIATVRFVEWLLLAGLSVLVFTVVPAMKAARDLVRKLWRR